MSAPPFPVTPCATCSEIHTDHTNMHAALTRYPQLVAGLAVDHPDHAHRLAEDLALIGRCLFAQLYATVADLTNTQLAVTENAGAQFITAVRLEHQPGFDIDWNGGTFNRNQIAADLRNARLENPDADWRVLQVTDVTNAIAITEKAA